MILSKKVKRASKTVVVPWFNTCKNFSTNDAVLKPALGDRSIFKSTSTPQLIKKSLVYRMSKSEFVLKHGSNLIGMSYKYLGKETTNSLIEKTAGEVFTSGPNIKTLIVDIDKFYNERGIYSGANYVLEGCEKDDIPTFNRCRDYLIETLDRVCKTRPYAHLAIKLSGLAQMEMFKRYHKAQHTLMHNLFLQYSIKSNEGRRVLSKEGLERFCKDNNYNITDSNINEFIEIAKFKNSKFGKNEISDVEFFANVHAHYFNSDKHNSNLIKQICEKSEITAETREEILRFEKRFEAIV